MGLCSGKPNSSKNNKQQSQNDVNKETIYQKIQNISLQKYNSPDSHLQRNNRLGNFTQPNSAQHQLTMILETYQMQREKLKQSPRTIRSHQTLLISKRNAEMNKLQESDFIPSDELNKDEHCIYKYFVNKITGRIYYTSSSDLSVENIQYSNIRLNKTALTHPHIIEILEIENEEQLQKDKLYFEYCSLESLQVYIDKHLDLNLEQISIIASQIISVVGHLHSKQLYHNNLDMQSFHFFVNSKYHYLKLTNISGIFQLKKLENSSTNFDTIDKYKSPELDIWQIGLIIYQMISKLNVSKIANYKDLDNEIWLETIKSNLRLPQNIIGINLRSLILAMLQLAPQQRIKIEQIQENKFIQLGNQEFVKLHRMKLIPQNVHKKINYLQKCFSFYVIQSMVPQQFLIMQKLYDILDKIEDNSLNLINLCKLMQELFEDSNVISDYQQLIESNQQVGFQDFLVMNINLSRVLTIENLRKGFQILSNKSQYISKKSLVRLMQTEQLSLNKEFEKHCLRWRFTYEHFINFMEKLK
ncbi:unnamed protein product [Paramecium sonneborni]|uniref:Protein kinase domain-containing protein n=1 Tax=Paramecium sonneborni TaxID=65129 RepID=A0A8S1L3A5_9CILI|nr:unnamed protein product [Paramecium sonneborni]